MRLIFKPTKPDPRVLILQIAIASLLSFSFRSFLPMAMLFIAAVAIVTALQGWHKGIRSCLTYGLFVLLLWGTGRLGVPVISDIFPMFFMLMVRVYPVYLLCIVLVTRAPMNELLTALGKLHIPQAALIPLAVIYRYVPTISKEIAYVRESIKMRGMNTSVFSMMRHPVRAAERFLIPLLSRSEKISEELSAASLCKGLTTWRQRSNCTDVCLGWQDACYTAGMAVVAAILLIINHTC